MIGKYGNCPEQLEELTEQVLALTEEVKQMREVQEFDKKLLS